MRRKRKRSPDLLDWNLIQTLESQRDYWFREDGWPRHGTVDGELFFALVLGDEFVGCLGDVEDYFIDSMEARTVRGINVYKSVAKVWLDEGRGVLCARFPYKKEVIEEFRNKIPKGKKSWNAELKVWEFSVEAIDVLLEILSRWFDEVVDLTREAATYMVGEEDSLLKLLDKEDVQAIYRMLAKKYHPDRGGSGDKMAQINKVLRPYLK